MSRCLDSKLETFCGLCGQYFTCFIFGALCPSKSGVMNKHIVKHIESAKKSREREG